MSLASVMAVVAPSFRVVRAVHLSKALVPSEVALGRSTSLSFGFSAKQKFPTFSTLGSEMLSRASHPRMAFIPSSFAAGRSIAVRLLQFWNSDEGTVSSVAKRGTS